jgi:hypothetical protein
MTGEVALIREQGQTFAVLAVKPHVVRNPSEREALLATACGWFGVRTALLAEDGRTWSQTTSCGGSRTSTSANCRGASSASNQTTITKGADHG